MITNAIIKELENFQPADFRVAINSMPRRVQLVVIEAEGGAIRY